MVFYKEVLCFIILSYIPLLAKAYDALDPIGNIIKLDIRHVGILPHDITLCDKHHTDRV